MATCFGQKQLATIGPNYWNIKNVYFTAVYQARDLTLHRVKTRVALDVECLKCTVEVWTAFRIIVYGN
jgi:hypothetical protein